MRHKSQFALSKKMKLIFMIYIFGILLSCTNIMIFKTKSNEINKDIKRSYFTNGNIEYEAKFLNGKLEGESRTWYKNGIIHTESQYNNGIPHGTWKKYHLDGSIMYEVQYIYGKKHGKEIWYYNNGQMKSLQKFNYDNPLEEIIRWEPNGDLLY
tara:strand:+ start:229 stop:690 length:462 start_codon:yes stop_codon:yes gene_type:complete